VSDRQRGCRDHACSSASDRCPDHPESHVRRAAASTLTRPDYGSRSIDDLEILPPVADRRPVTDILHGVEIVDDYRWLEDGESADTRTWVAAQNQTTRTVLDRLPGRERVCARLSRLFATGSISAPEEAGDHLIFLRRGAGENQPRLMATPRADEPHAPAGGRDATPDNPSDDDRVLIDPNTIDPDGTTAIDWWYPSQDGTLVAFGSSSDGDENSTLRVVGVESGEVLPDLIPGTRFATLGWLPDSSSFYYTANTRGRDDADLSSAYYHRTVYFHRLGTNSEDDPVAFPDDGDPETQPAVSLSCNGRWLLVRVHRGWDQATIYLRDLSLPDGEFLNITEGMDGLFNPRIAGDQLYLHTNYLAPRYRLMRVSLQELIRCPGGGPTDYEARSLRDLWVEVVPERSDAVLEAFVVTSSAIVLRYLRNARSELVAIDLEGSGSRIVALPGAGSVTAMTGQEERPDVFAAFESFTVPTTVFRYRSDIGALQRWRELDAGVDAGKLKTEQVWYPSKDGSAVSMFVIGPRNAPRDGSLPTLLTGYGGFNVSMTPLFSPSFVSWIEQGGAVAVANLRGGAEYGEEWHRAGMQERKQNVFDDFIGAAEYLIEQKYTSARRLAIYGGSNGGLLVGAAITQRPDLFRVAICAVPLLDMLRYQHFLIARLWIPEYGSSEDPDQFAYLRAYSPYHNISDVAEYPAILFMAAESDSRVDPMHARKMAARMQGRVRSRGPILLRIESKAGHGAGKPVDKLVEQYADVWSYLWWQLG
jgi:prolyl oligopeptidase